MIGGKEIRAAGRAEKGFAEGWREGGVEGGWKLAVQEAGQSGETGGQLVKRRSRVILHEDKTEEGVDYKCFVHISDL